MPFKKLTGSNLDERKRSLHSRASRFPTATATVNRQVFRNLSKRFSEHRLATLGWAPQNLRGVQINAPAVGRRPPQRAYIYIPTQYLVFTGGNNFSISNVPAVLDGEPPDASVNMSADLQRRNNEAVSSTETTPFTQSKNARQHLEDVREDMEYYDYPGFYPQRQLDADMQRAYNAGHYAASIAFESLPKFPNRHYKIKDADKYDADPDSPHSSRKPVTEQQLASYEAHNTIPNPNSPTYVPPEPQTTPVPTRAQRDRINDRINEILANRSGGSSVSRGFGNVDMRRRRRQGQRRPRPGPIRLGYSTTSLISPGAQRGVGTFTEQQIANEIAAANRARALRTTDNNQSIDNQSGQQPSVGASAGASVSDGKDDEKGSDDPAFRFVNTRQRRRGGQNNNNAALGVQADLEAIGAAGDGGNRLGGVSQPSSVSQDNVLINASSRATLPRSEPRSSTKNASGSTPVSNRTSTSGSTGSSSSSFVTPVQIPMPPRMHDTPSHRGTERLDSSRSDGSKTPWTGSETSTVNGSLGPPPWEDDDLARGMANVNLRSQTGLTTDMGNLTMNASNATPLDQMKSANRQSDLLATSAGINTISSDQSLPTLPSSGSVIRRRQSRLANRRNVNITSPLLQSTYGTFTTSVDSEERERSLVGTASPDYKQNLNDAFDDATSRSRDQALRVSLGVGWNDTIGDTRNTTASLGLSATASPITYNASGGSRTTQNASGGSKRSQRSRSDAPTIDDSDAKMSELPSNRATPGGDTNASQTSTSSSSSFVTPVQIPYPPTRKSNVKVTTPAKPKKTTPNASRSGSSVGMASAASNTTGSITDLTERFGRVTPAISSSDYRGARAPTTHSVGRTSVDTTDSSGSLNTLVRRNQRSNPAQSLGRASAVSATTESITDLTERFGRVTPAITSSDYRGVRAPSTHLSSGITSQSTMSSGTLGDVITHGTYNSRSTPSRSSDYTWTFQPDTTETGYQGASSRFLTTDERVSTPSQFRNRGRRFIPAPSTGIGSPFDPSNSRLLTTSASYDRSSSVDSRSSRPQRSARSSRMAAPTDESGTGNTGMSSGSLGDLTTHGTYGTFSTPGSERRARQARMDAATDPSGSASTGISSGSLGDVTTHGTYHSFRSPDTVEQSSQGTSSTNITPVQMPWPERFPARARQEVMLPTSSIATDPTLRPIASAMRQNQERHRQMDRFAARGGVPSSESRSGSAQDYRVIQEESDVDIPEIPLTQFTQDPAAASLERMRRSLARQQLNASRDSLSSVSIAPPPSAAESSSSSIAPVTIPRPADITVTTAVKEDSSLPDSNPSIHDSIADQAPPQLNATIEQSGDSAQGSDLAGQYHDMGVASVVHADDGAIGSISTMILPGSSQIAEDGGDSRDGNFSDISSIKPAQDGLQFHTDPTGLHLGQHGSGPRFRPHGHSAGPNRMRRRLSGFSHEGRQGLEFQGMRRGRRRPRRPGGPPGDDSSSSDDSDDFKHPHHFGPTHHAIHTHHAKNQVDMLDELTSRTKLGRGAETRMLIGHLAGHKSFHDDHFNPSDLYLHALDAQRRTGKQFPKDVLVPLRNNHELYRELQTSATPENIDLPTSAHGSQATLVAAKHRENIYRIMGDAPGLFRAIASSYTHNENSTRESLIKGLQRKANRMLSNNNTASDMEARKYLELANGLSSGHYTIPQAKYYLHSEHTFHDAVKKARERTQYMDKDRGSYLESIMGYRDFDSGTQVMIEPHQQSSAVDMTAPTIEKDVKRRMPLVKDAGELGKKIQDMLAQGKNPTTDPELSELVNQFNIAKGAADSNARILEFDRQHLNTDTSNVGRVGKKTRKREMYNMTQRRIEFAKDIAKKAGFKIPRSRLVPASVARVSEPEFKGYMLQMLNKTGKVDPQAMLSSVREILDAVHTTVDNKTIVPTAQSSDANWKLLKSLMVAAKVPGARNYKYAGRDFKTNINNARAYLDKAEKKMARASKRTTKEKTGAYDHHMNPHAHDHAIEQYNNLHHIIQHDGFKTEYPDRFVYIARTPQELEQLKLIVDDLYEMDETSGRLKKVSKEELRMQRPYIKLKDHVTGGAFLPSHAYHGWRKHTLQHDNAHLHRGFDYDDHMHKEPMPRRNHHDPGIMHVGAGFGDLFESAWKSTKSAFSDMGSTIAQTAENVGHGIAKAGKHLVSSTLDDIRDVGEDWEDLGHDIKRAITHPTWNNITAAGASVGQAVAGTVSGGFEIANNTVQFIKHAPGISEANLALSFVPGVGNLLSTIETAIPLGDAILKGDWDRAGKRGLELGVSLALGGLAKHGSALDDVASGAIGAIDDVDDIGAAVLQKSSGLMSKLRGAQDKIDDVVAAGISKGKDIVQGSKAFKAAVSGVGKLKEGLKANDAIIQLGQNLQSLSAGVSAVNPSAAAVLHKAGEVAINITDPAQFDAYAQALYSKYGVGTFEMFKKKLGEQVEKAKKTAKAKAQTNALKHAKAEAYKQRIEELKSKGYAVPTTLKGGGFFSDSSVTAQKDYNNRNSIQFHDQARGPGAYATMRGKTQQHDYARDQIYQARKEAQHFEVPLGQGAAKLEGLGKGLLQEHNDPIELEERAALALNDHRREHQPREMPYGGHRPMAGHKIEGGAHKNYSKKLPKHAPTHAYHFRNARRLRGKRGAGFGSMFVRNAISSGLGGSIASGGSIHTGGGFMDDARAFANKVHHKIGDLPGVAANTGGGLFHKPDDGLTIMEGMQKYGRGYGVSTGLVKDKIPSGPIAQDIRDPRKKITGGNFLTDIAAGLQTANDVMSGDFDVVNKFKDHKRAMGGNMFGDVKRSVNVAADKLGDAIGGNFRDDGPPEHERDGVAPPMSTHTRNHITGRPEPPAIKPHNKPPGPPTGAGLLDSIKNVGNAIGTTATEGVGIVKDGYNIAKDTINTGIATVDAAKEVYGIAKDQFNDIMDTYHSDKERVESIKDRVDKIKSSYDKVSGGAFGGQDEIRPPERKDDGMPARTQPTPDGHNLHVVPDPKRPGVAMGKPQTKIAYRTPPEAELHSSKITTGMGDPRDRLQGEMMEILRQNKGGIPPRDPTHPNALTGRQLANIRRGYYNPILHARAAPGLWDRKIYMRPNHYERENMVQGRLVVPQQYMN